METLSLISDLVAYTGVETIIQVLGYDAENDGGGGIFTLQTFAVAPILDGGIYFSSTFTSKYWVRQDRTEVDSFMSVKWFGAGTSLINDLTAIINATSAASTRQVPVFFPNGVYVISAPFNTVYPGGTWMGESHNAIIKLKDTTNLYGTPTVGVRPKTGMMNIQHSGWTVVNLTFDQNFTNSGQQFSPSGNTIAMGPATGLDTVAGVAACIMLGKLDGSGGVDNTAPALTDIRIADCVFTDYYGDAINALDFPCEEVTISGNSFLSSFMINEWDYASIGGEQAVAASGTTDRTCKRWSVRNNTLKGCFDKGIALNGFCEDFQVTGNFVVSVKGAFYINNASRVDVRDNDVCYYQRTGAVIKGIAAVRCEDTGVSRMITILNNFLYAPTGSSADRMINIECEGDGITVEENKIVTEDTADNDYGIYLGYSTGCVNVRILNNYIALCTSGINIAGDTLLLNNVEIRGNSIHDFTDYGIFVTDDTVTASGSDKISLRIEDNSIYGTGGTATGIKIETPASGILQNNIVGRNKFIGCDELIVASGYFISPEILRSFRFISRNDFYTGQSGILDWTTMMDHLAVPYYTRLAGCLFYVANTSNGGTSSVGFTATVDKGGSTFQTFLLASGTRSTELYIDLDAMDFEDDIQCTLSITSGSITAPNSVRCVLDLYYLKLEEFS